MRQKLKFHQEKIYMSHAYKVSLKNFISSLYVLRFEIYYGNINISWKQLK